MPGYTYTILCCRSRGEADLDRDPLHDVAGLDTMGSALERHTEGEGLPAVRERARELAAASVSANTRRAYEGALRRLQDWLDGRSLRGGGSRTPPPPMAFGASCGGSRGLG